MRLLCIFLLVMTDCGCSRNQTKVGTPENQHGLRQMQAMLQDRLHMNQYSVGADYRYVTEADSIYQWAAEHFKSEDNKIRFFWNDTPPDNHGAVHQPPNRGRVGWIQLIEYNTKNQPKPSVGFEYLWACLFFELLNIQHYEEFNEIRQKAISSQLSKIDFCVQNMRVEHSVRKEIELVYAQVWLPWCKLNGFESDQSLWGLPVKEFDFWVVDKERTPSYRKHYEDMYDALLQWSQRQNQ